MLLDSSDRRALEDIAKREGFTKKLRPIVVTMDLVLAVVMYFVLEPPVNLWVALALVVSSVVMYYLFTKVIPRGAGSASSVLEGRNPSRTMIATVVGDIGDKPFQWTFTTDSQVPAERYIHMGRNDETWNLSPGQRYSVSFFGEPHRPFRSVVLVVPEGGSTKRWQFSASVSGSERYVNRSN